ncbi:MAG: sulfite exporter TauE/SafE family protein [Eubacteriales bacterium]
MEILVYVLAGVGAGLGTGLAGMSAAAVIAPMLITFVGMDAYQAIGVALASDVMASAISAYVYKKNDNIDIKNGMTMMITVLIFTLIGSVVSSYVPATTMGDMSVFATLFLGLKFIFAPVMTTKQQMESMSPKKRMIQSIGGGCVIGSICGFMGAGGGIMMLLILTTILGYELKTAVGTSVFIMAFTALTGAVSHFIIGGMPDIVCLLVCILSTVVFARLAAVFANKASAKALNRGMGILLVGLAVVMITVTYFI